MHKGHFATRNCVFEPTRATLQPEGGGGAGGRGGGAGWESILRPWYPSDTPTGKPADCSSGERRVLTARRVRGLVRTPFVGN